MYISGKAAEALRHFDRLVFRDSHVLLNREFSEYRSEINWEPSTELVVKIQSFESLKYLPLYKVIRCIEIAK